MKGLSLLVFLASFWKASFNSNEVMKDHLFHKWSLWNACLIVKFIRNSVTIVAPKMDHIDLEMV